MAGRVGARQMVLHHTSRRDATWEIGGIFSLCFIGLTHSPCRQTCIQTAQERLWCRGPSYVCQYPPVWSLFLNWQNLFTVICLSMASYWRTKKVVLLFRREVGGVGKLGTSVGKLGTFVGRFRAFRQKGLILEAVRWRHRTRVF